MMGDVENNQVNVPGLYLLAAYDIFKILQQVLEKKKIRINFNSSRMSFLIFLFGSHFMKFIVESYLIC
jgi:hypothetical protein